MLMIFTYTLVQSQELPPKHRGMHPTLKADGTVVDESGKPLGSIKNDGKVCDVTGKVIGVIATTGEVTSVNTKGIIGVIQKDGTFKSKKGDVVTTTPDGTLMVAGKIVGHVEEAYKNKAHACALHCFFNAENLEASEIDNPKETHKNHKMDSEKTAYACPMHPDITSDKTGRCSKCGMDLVKK